MLRSYEFQGKNVERALEKASSELNIPAENIKHEVVAYGSSGIFGLVGVKKAKIKVFVEREKGKEKRAATRADPLNTIDPGDQASSPTANDPVIDDGEIVDYGRQTMQEIADGITSGATVNGLVKDDKLHLVVSGGESGVLIGKRGQTLEAIQYLVEKMVNKRASHRVRVIVDVEGYLEKRKSNLQQIATRMAEKARRTKKPVTIGQMNAHDRRIIHIHLKDAEGVRTQSIGNGYYRKLMIFPKNQPRPGRRNSSGKT